MKKNRPCSREEEAALVAEEWLLVRDSGELPETAFHSALHYLTVDPEGPKLQLSAEQRLYLLEASTLRFCDIILRDLDFAQRNSPASRGMARAIVNYRRFSVFCRRQGLDGEDVRLRVRAAFEDFLRAARKEEGVVLNCPLSVVQQFAGELGTQLPEGVARFLFFSEIAGTEGAP